MTQRLNVIPTHCNAHLDEYMGMWAMIRFGAMRFAMTEQGPYIDYVEDEAALEHKYADRDDIAMIGTGGGEFDEHRPEGRLPDDCATTLVAKALNLFECEELRPLWNAALWADTHVDPTRPIDENGQKLRLDPRALEWASIIKVLHGYAQVNNHHVFELCQIVFDAMASSLASEPGRDSAPNLFIASSLSDELNRGDANAVRKPEITTVAIPAFARYDTLVKAMLVLWHHNRLWSVPAGHVLELKLVANQYELRQLLLDGDDVRQDVVFIGFEDGQFPLGQVDETTGNLAAGTGVRYLAKQLRVNNMAELEAIIKDADSYVRGLYPDVAKDPREPRLFDLGNVVEALNRHSELDAESIFDLVREVLEAVRGKGFAKRRAEAEFNEKLAKKEALLGLIGGIMTAIVASDNPAMQSYLHGRLQQECSAREWPQVYVMLIIGSRTRGIFGSESLDSGVMARVAGNLLLAERLHDTAQSGIELERSDVAETSASELAAIREAFSSKTDMVMPGAKHWWLWASNQGIMNGSLTHPIVRVTPLGAKELIAAVVAGLRGA